ncbi:hypothetical protein PV327_006893 [Microctonus hyperodae]|uniref:Cyclin-dependent kinase 2-interacting protein n=1 Tax=Microctonus hyperodae TaxID=165561 RepID=A0AA39F576_MICHY|nr:hypothetical protein PV327_006893 [Microctonus hyperodae]
MANFLPTITSPKPSTQVNLTGNPRILKDLAADTYNFIQKWNKVHLHGMSLLRSITELKVDSSYPRGLQELCDDLEKDVDQMDRIVTSLKSVVSRTNAVVSLQEGKKGKIFTTWPTEYFSEAIEEIYEAYKNEAMMKRKILENVAHFHQESMKMLHLTIWAHQSMIPHKLGMTLQSLLAETGHR